MKVLQGHRVFLTCLDLKFPQIQPRNGKSLLNQHSKVIGLTNFELKISSYQSQAHEPYTKGENKDSCSLNIEGPWYKF